MSNHITPSDMKMGTLRGPAWRVVKRIAKHLLGWHLPVLGPAKLLFSGLYSLHVLVREMSAWLMRFCWYEPLFRSQCASVGSGFSMEQLPYLTGRGRICIGNRVRLSGKSGLGFGKCLREAPEIVIGDGTFVGHDCSLIAADSIRIGKNCLIARGVSIRDFDGHPLDAEKRRDGLPTPIEGVQPVVIGDDVWIGAGAIILKGVTIGDRAVVGAGAVVASDIAADSIVVGNPARAVKKLAA